MSGIDIKEQLFGNREATDVDRPGFNWDEHLKQNGLYLLPHHLRIVQDRMARMDSSRFDQDEVVGEFASFLSKGKHDQPLSDTSAYTEEEVVSLRKLYDLDQSYLLDCRRPDLGIPQQTAAMEQLLVGINEIRRNSPDRTVRIGADNREDTICTFINGQHCEIEFLRRILHNNRRPFYDDYHDLVNATKWIDLGNRILAEATEEAIEEIRQEWPFQIALDIANNNETTVSWDELRIAGRSIMLPEIHIPIKHLSYDYETGKTHCLFMDLLSQDPLTFSSRYQSKQIWPIFEKIMGPPPREKRE